QPARRGRTHCDAHDKEDRDESRRSEELDSGLHAHGEEARDGDRFGQSAAGPATRGATAEALCQACDRDGEDSETGESGDRRNAESPAASPHGAGSDGTPGDDGAASPPSGEANPGAHFRWDYAIRWQDRESV